ncbi:MAG: branched-chain amino acid ABC transporter permease [Acidimicrobiales bacterium]
MIWTNAVIQGLLLGGLYAIFACGLSLMFGVMRLVNLAHGDLGVLGAYFSIILIEHLGGNPLWTFAAVIPVAAVVGYLLQRFLLDRALNGGELSPILVTFGLSIIIENLLQQTFGANDQSLNIGALSYQSWKVATDIYVGRLNVIIFVVAVLVIIGLQLFLSKTRAGRALRATADSRRAAALSGIDPKRTRALATAIALATVAVGGLFLAMRSSFAPSSGSADLLFAFEAVIIGGLGNLWGTLVGGLVLGVAQTVGSQINPADGILIGDLVFLAVLAFRPQGLIASRNVSVR